ncbi:MAG TPA: pantetheine-phosphate adenylyltransferase [Actinomycetes bacterium]|nr:pantetheine-phosphate adenylyltransferase [Actinomycetes bacterium]
MLKVVCPGSFDPVTNGHVDIIERASKLADQVYVAVMVNQNKRGEFAIDERIVLLERSVQHLDNVAIEAFEGLLVDYCRDRDARAIVKGLRAVGDFDYELQMAQMNHRLTGVDTLFVATNPLYSFLSSSLIKEVVAYGGDVSGLVPAPVLGPLIDRLRQDRAEDID